MCLVRANVEYFMLNLNEHRRIGSFDQRQTIFSLLKDFVGLAEFSFVLIRVRLSEFEEALVLQTVVNTSNLYFYIRISCIFLDALIFLFLEFR